MKVKLLPYLLLTFLPTQLGKYFFLPISYISGLRSDYLAISFYLTDIISVAIVLIYFVNLRHSGKPALAGASRILFSKHRSWTSQDDRKKSLYFPILLVVLFLYLLLSSLFVSATPIISLFKLAKLLEMGLLCFVFIKSNLNVQKVILSLSMGAFYSSILAIAQFVKGASLNGLWWLLGERTFTTSTPGIATFSLNGMRFLRPYATFPHPNVLAGFLAISSLTIFWYLRYKKPVSKKIFYYFAAVLSLSLIALILTVSRSALLAYLVGVFLLLKPIKLDGKIILALLGGVLISIFIPLFIPSQGESIVERKVLIEKSFDIILRSPILGVGLNRFIQIPNNNTHSMGVSTFQPVHNVFLLILSEVGIIGVFLFLIIVHLLFYDLKLFYSSYFPILFSLFLLSLFDHYLFTLQEGTLTVVTVVSLAFLARKKYT